jgi:HK97 family phage portal protein
LISDVERSTSWGEGIEQQGIGFVTYTLNPWITRLEEAFNQLLPRGQFLKFNVNGLLRGDAAARGTYYQTLGQLKAIHINEIRALEDMPPLPDGDAPPPAPNESI